MGPAIPEFVAGIMIVIGAWFVMFGKPLAVYFAYYQRKLLQLLHVDIELNPQIVAAMRIVFVAAGIVLAGTGLLTLIVVMRR